MDALIMRDVPSSPRRHHIGVHSTLEVEDKRGGIPQQAIKADGHYCPSLGRLITIPNGCNNQFHPV